MSRTLTPKKKANSESTEWIRRNHLAYTFVTLGMVVQIKTWSKVRMFTLLNYLPLFPVISGTNILFFFEILKNNQ